MSQKVRNQRDADLDAIRVALAKYKEKHPKADEPEVKRQNVASLRIRIVDPGFSKMSWADRHDDVWNYLESLPEHVLGQVSMLVLVTPQEKKQSLVSLEFDDPTHSPL